MRPSTCHASARARSRSRPRRVRPAGGPGPCHWTIDAPGYAPVEEYGSFIAPYVLLEQSWEQAGRLRGVEPGWYTLLVGAKDRVGLVYRLRLQDGEVRGLRPELRPR